MGFDLGTDDGYRRFIGAQAGAMIAVEEALDRAGAASVIDDWQGRRRSDLLIEDSRALAIDIQPVAAPRLDDAAAIAGALYVVEGSRHGARHLRRLVPDDAPSAFLDADQVQGNWAKLLDRIDTILYDPTQRDRAVAAALGVFGAFEQSGRMWMKA